MKMSGTEKMITLIIPFYNCEDTIGKCLESVSNQTIDKEKLEVLLVNDGSTDGSTDIVKNFALENNFASVITQEHRGAGSARNSGITAATGKYIAFLDADDSITPDTLKKITNFFEEHFEETDIVTYALIPYINGNRKKKSYRYKDGDSTVYDLESSDNKYLCPDEINIAVKNRGDENILFDADVTCDLETLNFCIDCVKDKMTLGFVGGCEYRKTDNPSGTRKNLECSLYFDSFIGRWENIFADYETVPRYVQALFCEDMLRRIVKDCLLPYHIEGDTYRKEIQRIENLLQKTDDDIILNFPDSAKENIFYLISMKYKGDLECEATKTLKLKHGDSTLFESDHIDLIITKFKVRESGVEVCGYISSPAFDYCEKPTLILRERSSNEPLEIRECSFCYNCARIRNNTAWGFRKIFNTDKRLSFSFTVEIGERSYPIDFSCGEWVPFNNNRKHFVLNGFSCKMSERCIVIEKADRKAEKKYRKAELKKYLRRNKKVFAVRFINYLMSKKRIWLYHDCKGVGVDNGYYQFVHDFEIDDGVERYYVVNGSIDAVRDKFTPEQQKFLIAFRSTKHKLMYLNAEKIITAFIENENYLPYYGDIYPEYIDLFGGDVYYLQHGVLHAHLPWKYSYDRLDVTGEVISTSYEEKNFTENYFFPEDALIKSKMPRYDRVDTDGERAKKIILLAPSWRKYLISHKAGGGWIPDKQKFKKSEYFIKTQEFLESPELEELLEKNDLMLEFKLHPIFEPYKDCFKFDSSRISFAQNRPIDEYSIFITDYSSFVFDFVYLNRAIVYFLPDVNEFKAGMNDYRELDIPFENGFGEFTVNKSELCRAIGKIAQNSCEPISPYKEKNADFFLDKEKNACDRITEFLKNT